MTKPSGEEPFSRKRNHPAHPSHHAQSAHPDHPSQSGDPARPGRPSRAKPPRSPSDRDGRRPPGGKQGEPRKPEARGHGEIPSELQLPEIPLEAWSELTRVEEHKPADDSIGRATEAVLAPCHELLQGALSRLGARAGLLYGVEESRRLVVLSTVAITDANDLAVAERAASSALESRRTLVARGIHARSESPEALLVVPCTLQGDVAAVLVTTRSTAPEPVDTELGKLGSTLPFALAADRARIHFTLAERMMEAEAIRRQLEAYAVDLRSVFLSERARSDELGQTLVELEETYEATVRGLAIAVEAKDEYTGGHLFRVSRYGMTMTAIVAPEHRDDPQFEYGFLLHDVGKLAVPDAVLAKSGALTEEEWEQIRAHPASGRTILERIPFLAGASEIVFCHHERWDGNGFPRGLQGDEIPLGARIFPIADAFDAMTTSRPYRKAIPITEAREELVRGAGTQFWSDAVDAFMSIPVEELETLQRGTHGISGW